MTKNGEYINSALTINSLSYKSISYRECKNFKIEIASSGSAFDIINNENERITYYSGSSIAVLDTSGSTSSVTYHLKIHETKYDFKLENIGDFDLSGLSLTFDEETWNIGNIGTKK